MSELVVLGKVIGTHGIKGSLKIHSYSGNIDTFKKVDSIVLRFQDEVEKLHLETVSQASSKIILNFKEHKDINSVEKYIGREVCVFSHQLPKLGIDEYYHKDLIGLNVYTDEDLYLGVLSQIFETGSNDVYVVRDNKKELLLPAISKVIKKVDLDSNKMIVTLLEGMLEV